MKSISKPYTVNFRTFKPTFLGPFFLALPSISEGAFGPLNTATFSTALMVGAPLLLLVVLTTAEVDISSSGSSSFLFNSPMLPPSSYRLLPLPTPTSRLLRAIAASPSLSSSLEVYFAGWTMAFGQRRSWSMRILLLMRRWWPVKRRSGKWVLGYYLSLMRYWSLPRWC